MRAKTLGALKCGTCAPRGGQPGVLDEYNRWTAVVPDPYNLLLPMRTRAVFFDLYNTLAGYQPSREEVQVLAANKLGVPLTLEGAYRGVSAADDYWWRQNSRQRVEERSDAERQEVYFGWQRALLEAAGVDASPHTVARMLAASRSLGQSSLVLYDDVLPTLAVLRGRGLTLAMLSNVDRDIVAFGRELGVADHLDFMLSSREVGADKPRAPIFLAALERAGASAEEAIHVGDQYAVDVAGARNVGIRPLLLDRHGVKDDVTDVPRIRSLSEIVGYL